MKMYYPRRFDFDTEEDFLAACEAFDNAESECEDAAVVAKDERLNEK